MTAPRYYRVDQWTTPASEYPRMQVGAWSIASERQAPGISRMQEYGAFYYHDRPLDLTVLREGETVWFRDEPRQMYALAEAGLFRAQGTVVAGGLGLGLIHHFLRMNPQVTQVITIERAPELETLVWPYMALGRLIIGDFYEVLPRLAAEGVQVDTIYTDFIFGYQDAKTWQELQAQIAFCHRHYPGAHFLEHGYQRQLDALDVPVQPSTLVPPDTLFDRVVVVH